MGFTPTLCPAAGRARSPDTGPGSPPPRPLASVTRRPLGWPLSLEQPLPSRPATVLPDEGGQVAGLTAPSPPGRGLWPQSIRSPAPRCALPGMRSSSAPPPASRAADWLYWHQGLQKWFLYTYKNIGLRTMNFSEWEAIFRALLTAPTFSISLFVRRCWRDGPRAGAGSPQDTSASGEGRCWDTRAVGRGGHRVALPTPGPECPHCRALTTLRCPDGSRQEYGRVAHTPGSGHPPQASVSHLQSRSEAAPSGVWSRGPVAGQGALQTANAEPNWTGTPPGGGAAPFLRQACCHQRTARGKEQKSATQPGPRPVNIFPSRSSGPGEVAAPTSLAQA